MAKITITRDDIKDYVFNKFTEYDKNDKIKLPTETLDDYYDLYDAEDDAHFFGRAMELYQIIDDFRMELLDYIKRTESNEFYEAVVEFNYNATFYIIKLLYERKARLY